MERGMKGLIGLLGLLTVPAAFAGLSFGDWDFRPNVGVDVGVTHQRFDAGFGEGHFREDYPSSNIYVGVTFLEWLGLELGYEHMYDMQKRQFYANVDNNPNNIFVLGFEIPGGIGGDRLYFSDAWSQSWHADLVGLWPVCKNIALTASVGISWMKMYFETVQIRDNNAATPVIRWNSGNEAMARFTVGVRQMINDYFGLRLQGIWENTSKVSATTVNFADVDPDLVPSLSTQNYTVDPKNNYSVTLGFFLQFC